MLNRLLIIWIVYAGVMGFAVGGSFVSAYLIPPPQHESSADPKRSVADQNTKEKSDEALARYTLWLTIFTGILAFATVALGIATVGLYAAGEKQFSLARQEFISTHRPKITVYSLAFAGSMADTKPIPISFRYVNSGDSDAIDGHRKSYFPPHPDYASW